MATTYYYRLFETEFGPVGFRELVALVRDGTINADDLVKADWQQDWHAAAEVIGLFHMAGRLDILDKWEAERAQQAADEVEGEPQPDDSEEAIADEEEEVPSWQRRIFEVEQQRRALEAEKERERRDELAQALAERQIQQTAAAAEAELDKKEARRRPSRIQQWKNTLFSSSALHRSFRWGMTFAAANLVAFGILTWSDNEAQRYPERRGATQQARVFPIWGECSSTEYLFLLCDAMAVAGLAAYGGARVLESMADD